MKPSIRLKNAGIGNPKRGGRPPGYRLRQHGGIYELLEDYLHWMEVTAYSPRTCDTRRYQIVYFLEWLSGKGITDPEKITIQQLETYQRFLFVSGTRGRRKLAIQTQRQHLTSIQQFLRWLYRQRYISANCANEMDLPRVKPSLPRALLSEKEVEQILAMPCVSDPTELRDRAIMEVFFSTAIRRNELAGLCTDDLIADEGLLIVRKGKGGKQRVVPIGERAIHWVFQYMHDVRLHLECSLSEKRIFLTEYGEPILPRHLSSRIGIYVKRAMKTKEGACHLFRHAAASTMLKNGADIRHIQEMLGHASIESSAIYLHMEISDLKEVHRRTHPAG